MLRFGLTQQGYEVWEASNGLEAHDLLREIKPDLVILDLNLPGIKGQEVCHSIRMADPNLPIVILSVCNAETDKVSLLDAGADDFVTKPFSLPELTARVRRCLRRTHSPAEESLTFRDDRLEIDFASRRIVLNGKRVRLTPKETEVLRYLVAHAGKPVTHRELLRSVWGADYGDEVGYLRVFINRLRMKIEPNPAEPAYVLTEPWVGYVFAQLNPSSGEADRQ